MVETGSQQQIREEAELAKLRMTVGHETSLVADKPELLEDGEQVVEKDSAEDSITTGNNNRRRRLAHGWGKLGDNGVLPAKDSLNV